MPIIERIKLSSSQTLSQAERVMVEKFNKLIDLINDYMIKETREYWLLHEKALEFDAKDNREDVRKTAIFYLLKEEIENNGDANKIFSDSKGNARKQFVYGHMRFNPDHPKLTEVSEMISAYTQFLPLTAAQIAIVARLVDSLAMVVNTGEQILGRQTPEHLNTSDSGSDVEVSSDMANIIHKLREDIQNCRFDLADCMSSVIGINCAHQAEVVSKKEDGVHTSNLDFNKDVYFQGRACKVTASKLQKARYVDVTHNLKVNLSKLAKKPDLYPTTNVFWQDQSYADKMPKRFKLPGENVDSVCGFFANYMLDDNAVLTPEYLNKLYQHFHNTSLADSRGVITIDDMEDLGTDPIKSIIDNIRYSMMRTNEAFHRQWEGHFDEICGNEDIKVAEVVRPIVEAPKIATTRLPRLVNSTPVSRSSSTGSATAVAVLSPQERDFLIGFQKEALDAATELGTEIKNCTRNKEEISKEPFFSIFKETRIQSLDKEIRIKEKKRIALLRLSTANSIVEMKALAESMMKDSEVTSGFFSKTYAVIEKIVNTPLPALPRRISR